MAVADKIIALLDTMTQTSLDSLPPVRRRQFADLCRHWADVAERSKALQPAGARGPVSAPADAQAGSPSRTAVAGDAER
jgi:hypothetical protein